MMEVTKVLLYCTKAKPFMAIDEDGYHLVEHPTGDLNDYAGKVFNGLIGFECDCKEAFDISKVVQTNKNLSLKIRNVYDTEEVTLYRGLKTALTLKQIEVYQGDSKTLYAYHFENVKPIDPMPITQLYKDEACTIHLTRAPESYCFAYRRHDCTDEEARMINYYWDSDKWLDSEGHECFQDFYCWYYIEKCLIFSIRSPWLCKIANGEKDLEVRKTRILNAGIEYK